MMKNTFSGEIDRLGAFRIGKSLRKIKKTRETAPPAGRLCWSNRLIQRKTASVVSVDCAVPGGTRMAIVEQTPAGGTVLGDGRQGWIRTNWGLLLAVAVLAAILLLPTPADLPVAAHRMLAILGFAVIIWMTEASDYAVSAVVIAALMAFLLGLAPSVANPKVLMG